MRRCIYKKIHYLTFDLDLGVKVTRNVTQYPLHHVIYAPTKFQVATSNGLGEDTITRNVTDGRTDRQTDARTDGQTDGRTTDRLWYEINIPYFSYEKAGIIKCLAILLTISACPSEIFDNIVPRLYSKTHLKRPPKRKTKN